MHSRYKHNTPTRRNTDTPTQNISSSTCNPTENKSNTTTTSATYTTKPTSPSTKTKRITLSKFHLQQIHTNWTKSHKRNNKRYNQSYPHTNSKRTQPHNKITNSPFPQIHPSEESLPRHTRCTLAQLRTDKSPFLMAYKHHINPTTYQSPLCPICKITDHNTLHIFNCTRVPTKLTPRDLWHDPGGVGVLLDTWKVLMDQVPDGGWGCSAYFAEHPSNRRTRR